MAWLDGVGTCRPSASSSGMSPGLMIPAPVFAGVLFRNGKREAECSQGFSIIWFYYKGFHFDGNIILFMEEIIFKLFNLTLLSLGILWGILLRSL